MRKHEWIGLALNNLGFWSVQIYLQWSAEEPAAPIVFLLVAIPMWILLTIATNWAPLMRKFAYPFKMGEPTAYWPAKQWCEKNVGRFPILWHYDWVTDTVFILRKKQALKYKFTQT